MEELEVFPHYGIQEIFTPVSFIYRGHKFQLVSIGRRWTVRDEFHVLVMDFYHQIYHLIYKTILARWYLVENNNHTYLI